MLFTSRPNPHATPSFLTVPIDPTQGVPLLRFKRREDANAGAQKQKLQTLYDSSTCQPAKLGERGGIRRNFWYGKAGWRGKTGSLVDQGRRLACRARRPLFARLFKRSKGKWGSIGVYRRLGEESTLELASRLGSS